MYKDVWNAAVNEELPCQREPFNRQYVRSFLERTVQLCARLQEVPILEIYHKVVLNFHLLSSCGGIRKILKKLRSDSKCSTYSVCISSTKQENKARPY